MHAKRATAHKEVPPHEVHAALDTVLRNEASTALAVSSIAPSSPPASKGSSIISNYNPEDLAFLDMIKSAVRTPFTPSSTVARITWLGCQRKGRTSPRVPLATPIAPAGAVPQAYGAALSASDEGHAILPFKVSLVTLASRVWSNLPTLPPTVLTGCLRRSPRKSLDALNEAAAS